MGYFAISLIEVIVRKKSFMKKNLFVQFSRLARIVAPQEAGDWFHFRGVLYVSSWKGQCTAAECV